MHAGIIHTAAFDVFKLQVRVLLVALLAWHPIDMTTQSDLCSHVWVTLVSA